VIFVRIPDPEIDIESQHRLVSQKEIHSTNQNRVNLVTMKRFDDDIGVHLRRK
jgi:hypothetical protein